MPTFPAKNADATRDDRKQNTLRQKLARQPGGRRADSEPRADFAGARPGTSQEQQAGNICRSDKDEHSHYAQ